MPFTLASIQSALQTWAAGATTLTCIWENQDAPQPALPYCKLKMSPLRSLSAGRGNNVYKYDSTKPQGQEMQETFTDNKEFTLNLEVYASALQTGFANPAISYLENAIMTLGLQSTIQTLFAAGISLTEHESPLDVSALVATGFQSRATADIHFTTADQVSSGHGYIAEAEITTTIKDPADNTIVNVTTDVQTD